MKLPFVRNFSIRIKYSLPTMHFFTPEGRITDDLPLRGEIFESLKQTSYVKSIVTAQGKMDLERKGKQSYQGCLFSRLLAFSNGDLH